MKRCMKGDYYSLFIPDGFILRDAPQNYLATRNTADMTGGKPNDVLSQTITGVSAINSLIAFYEIHGSKREVLFFYFVPH
jgi:hypothetical protein